MTLATTYLKLSLSSPLVVSASPLSETLDGVRRLEDAGAAAIVLPSLFEEEITHDALAIEHHLSEHAHAHAEAENYFHYPHQLSLGPEHYLEHVRRSKQAVDVPVIGSLNGVTVGNWLDYARQIEQAGADALELNLYAIPADAALSAADIEQGYLDVVQTVRQAVRLPLAVKISPFFTNLSQFAHRLDEAGVDGLVLFNRFYQPDIDVESLEVAPQVLLSTPMAMRLPLRWIGLLDGRMRADLAATGGVHHAIDAVKLLMVGATVVMLCSALLKRGVDHLRTVQMGLASWLAEHEYESVSQLRSCLSQRHCADPAAFERAQYVRTLHSYRGPTL